MSKPKTWPPLWAVPVLLLLVIFLAVYASAALGWLGLVPLAVFIWWVQKRADEHEEDVRVETFRLPPRRSLMNMRRLVAVSMMLSVALSGCSSDSSESKPASDGGSSASTTVPASTPSLEASVRGRMKLEQRTFRPGDEVKVRWPDENLRGVAYSLDQWTGNDWRPAFYVSATTSRSSEIGPRWWPVDGSGYWNDIGLGGPGPDIAVVPDVATTGTYRLCTANARRLSCALLKVA